MRPFVLSIAGFDPSGSAGIAADFKTFEQWQVNGLGILTANTLQTEDEFFSIKWFDIDEITGQLRVILKTYPVRCIKIGITSGWEMVNAIVHAIDEVKPAVRVIWDPVIRSSTGWTFFRTDGRKLGQFPGLLSRLYLITPNRFEYETLIGRDEDADAVSEKCIIYRKGGHDKGDEAVDQLIVGGKRIPVKGGEKRLPEKHGSGCMLSAALTAALALDYPLAEACSLAKSFTEQRLKSSNSKRAYYDLSL